jgi:hypothetical protein
LLLSHAGLEQTRASLHGVPAANSGGFTRSFAGRCTALSLAAHPEPLYRAKVPERFTVVVVKPP